MATAFTTVDEYIESFTGETQARLIEFRDLVQRTLPEAEEGISYNIPAFRSNGTWAVYISGYAKHVSLSLGGRLGPIGGDHFAEELAVYKTSTAAIQFQNKEPFPTDLIQRIIAYRCSLLPVKK